MGLSQRLAGVLGAARVELRRGRDPGEVVELAAGHAAREVVGAVARSPEVRAAAVGGTLGVTLGTAARRLVDGDVGGALDGLAGGASKARDWWKGAR